MKQLSALALILVLLLNTVGYYLILVGLQYKHGVTITRAFDNGVHNTDANITFRLPISLPYMNNQVEFDRVNGVFEFGGEHYRLVKQKYSNDTLTVICIVDHEEKRIDQQMTDYVNSFAHTGSGDANAAKTTVNIMKDYVQQSVYQLASGCLGWQEEIHFNYHSCDSSLPSFVRSITHPPEIV